MPTRFTPEQRARVRESLLAQREVAEWAREARGDVGWTEIAIELGCTAPTLRQYLIGARMWPPAYGDFREEIERAIAAARARRTVGAA